MWFILWGFFLGGGGLGGGFSNLKFGFSGTSLVYSEKYGLQKSEGQKNPLLPTLFVNETKGIFEKNLKKKLFNTPKLMPKMTPKATSDSTPK